MLNRKNPRSIAVQKITSIILNLAFLSLLFATFFFQFEFLLTTRVILIFFAIGYLLIEIKKSYFSKKMTLFIHFAVVSMIALIIGIMMDDATANYKNFLIPVYAYILIMMMYKELRSIRETKSNLSSN